MLLTEAVEVAAALAGRGDRTLLGLVGPPGVGKTHLAVSLGLKAIGNGYRVLFTTAANLIATLTRAHADEDLACPVRDPSSELGVGMCGDHALTRAHWRHA